MADERYGRFVEIVELRNVYLERIVADRSALDSHLQEDRPSLRVTVEDSEDIRAVSSTGFQISVRVSVEVARAGGGTAEAGGSPAAVAAVDCVFVLEYTFQSAESLNEFVAGEDAAQSSDLRQLVELFARRNVRVNVWPYAREAIHSTTLRMGLPPLVLPLYKVSS